MSLFAKEIQEHLTIASPDLDRQVRASFPGMAHFADTGPSLKTCRECSFWTGCGLSNGYSARKGINGGMIKPRACEKYRSLRNGEIGGRVPHSARACKYFDENANPPAAFDKG